MRTPAQIARMLGWSEAKRQRRPLNLAVRAGRDFGGRWHPGAVWAWRLTDPDGQRIDGGIAPAQPIALAVGLAALEAASVHSGTHSRGTGA